MMQEYHELIAEHQTLQKQLADQPDAVEVERVLHLIAQARGASANIGDPQQREQLRAILRHWGAFVYERTGELPATQLAPYEPHVVPEREIPTPRKRAALYGLIAVIALVIAAAIWDDSLRSILTLARTPTPTPLVSIVSIETDTPTPTATPHPTVYLDPSAINLVVGETITVNIRVDNVQRLHSVRLELSFNPGYVQVEDTDIEAEGIQITPGEIPEPVEVALNQVTVDEGGRIIYQAAQKPGTDVDGSGVIASIVLRGVAKGGSPLDFDRVDTYDLEGNVLDIMALNGLITVVTGEATPTPTVQPAVIRPDNADRLVPLARLVGHEGAVLQVAFSPDGRLLASSGADGTVRLWSVADGSELTAPAAHVGWVQTVAFSPDGRWLASGGNDGGVMLSGTDSLQVFAEFYGHEGFVFDVAFSPDGCLLASSSGDGTVRLWDAESGREVGVIADGEKAVYGVTFSPDGARLATASVAGTVRIWDVATEAQVCTLNTSPALNVAFAPDGNSLATGNTEGQVIILDARTCQEKQVLEEHTDNVNAVVYSPDGQMLVSGSRDTTVKIWPLVPTPITPVTLRGHEESVETVAFSPDGRLLASASADGIIILWGLAEP